MVVCLIHSWVSKGSLSWNPNILRIHRTWEIPCGRCLMQILVGIEWFSLPPSTTTLWFPFHKLGNCSPNQISCKPRFCLQSLKHLLRSTHLISEMLAKVRGKGYRWLPEWLAGPPDSFPAEDFSQQLIGICLPIQGTRVQSLLWEDSHASEQPSPCATTTEPLCCNYWSPCA